MAPLRRKTALIYALGVVSTVLPHTSHTAVQVARDRVFSNVSHNGLYVVKTEGAYYEGFVGSQKVTLMDSSGGVLWEKTFRDRNFQIPTVSNAGDVAFALREGITFYNRPGELKGTYASDPGERLLYLTERGWTHAFSPDGKHYYTPSLREKKMVVQLISLSDSAQLEWKTDLDALQSVSMQFAQDRIVVDDFLKRGRRSTNRCYVLDINGAIVSYYDVDLRRPEHHPPVLRKDKGELWIFDGKDVKAFSISDGTFVSDVERGELVGLIYEKDTRSLIFGLSNLVFEAPSATFSRSDAERLEMLATYQSDPNILPRPRVAPLASTLLTKLESGNPLADYVSKSSLGENPEFLAWVDVWREVIPGLESDSFSLSTVNNVLLHGWPLKGRKHVGKDWRVRKMVMAHSPDSTMAVDYFGYPLGRKNGKWAFQKGPDQSVNLYDFTDSTLTSVFNCGTPCGTQIATWLDSTSFVVAGWGEDRHNREFVRPSLSLVVTRNPIRRSFIGPAVERTRLETVSKAIRLNREKKFPFIDWGQ